MGVFILVVVILGIGFWMYSNYVKVKTEGRMNMYTALPLAIWLEIYHSEKSPSKADMMAMVLVNSAVDIIFRKRSISGLSLNELLTMRAQVKMIPANVVIKKTIGNIGLPMIDEFGDPPLGNTPASYVFAIMLSASLSKEVKGDFNLKEIYEKIIDLKVDPASGS